MLRSLPPDARRLFAAQAVRLFAYSFLSVVLVLYLAAAGLSAGAIGVLLTLTLVGDTLVSLYLTTSADRFGRRRTLLVGAALMVAAGAVFALTKNFAVLLIAATIGVISPSGNEVGPFIAIDQAAMSQTVAEKARTRVFAWYRLAGALATALGSLAGGGLSGVLQHRGATAFASYRAVVLGYAALGVVLALLLARLSLAVEVAISPNSHRLGGFGLHRSRRVVFSLAGLFALDAFGGGLIVQSLVAYWFHLRFGAEPAMLGGIFFGANLFAGASALVAARIADRIGLINTMVFTHIPSNVLLILVPLMPTLPLAIAVLLLRFSISQMDVPARQSYTMAVVEPDERSAAAGITGVARTTGAALAPAIAVPLFASPALMGMPFILAGGLKIVYDLLLWVRFRSVRPRG
ncbi:MAG: MFS transporter [Thermoanaerobaculales bacterium]